MQFKILVGDSHFLSKFCLMLDFLCSFISKGGVITFRDDGSAGIFWRFSMTESNSYTKNITRIFQNFS